jgi:hypothetical protein
MFSLLFKSFIIIIIIIIIESFIYNTIFATDQMAEIAIADNTLVGMGREYKGAPGMHSYCMRQSRYGAENAPLFLSSVSCV